MDKTSLEQFLTESEDHIDRVRWRLDRQTMVVQRVKPENDIALAEELLEQFQQTLQALLADRDLILRLLQGS